MKIECFLDTNVLLYAASVKEELKRTRAIDLLDRAFGLSTQVLQEFYVNATRKLAIPLSPIEAIDWLDRLEKQPCVEVTMRLVRQAVVLSNRYRISYWDAAIVAAAEQLQAPILYTEDLSHGQSYGSVQVINPFV